MRYGCEADAVVMRHCAVPERERRTGEHTWNDTPAIAVAGSETTAAWLTAIAREAGLDWDLCALEETRAADILVLTEPRDGEDLEELCRRTGAQLAVVSLDHPPGRTLAASGQVQTFTFSEGRDAADLTAKNLRLTGAGLTFMAVTRDALSRVLTAVDDLYPAMAALACAAALGIPLERAAALVSSPLVQQVRSAT